MSENKEANPSRNLKLLEQRLEDLEEEEKRALQNAVELARKRNAVRDFLVEHKEELAPLYDRLTLAFSYVQSTIFELSGWFRTSAEMNAVRVRLASIFRTTRWDKHFLSYTGEYEVRTTVPVYNIKDGLGIRLICKAPSSCQVRPVEKLVKTTVYEVVGECDPLTA